MVSKNVKRKRRLNKVELALLSQIQMVLIDKRTGHRLVSVPISWSTSHHAEIRGAANAIKRVRQYHSAVWNVGRAANIRGIYRGIDNRCERVTLQGDLSFIDSLHRQT